MVNFVEHQLARDGRLCTVNFGSTVLKCCNHLFHHLIEEDMSELRVQEGTKLERDLGRKKEVGSSTAKNMKQQDKFFETFQGCTAVSRVCILFNLACNLLNPTFSEEDAV